ncbi:Mitochondrial outer membrane protein porin [Quillaja saponaria]|uniref:Mitochondrial outer membrane protein porin n=1 Tax=Quillaja saponaria TaxID=32244 RepID=A0AAD7LDX2_QUISA|nr:Mitochondrial outer membrane protein porin [Quillaja saponaria]
MSKCPGFYFDIGKKARDLLHKDYGAQPPIHFHYQFLDWNLSLSCQIEQIVPGLSSLIKFDIPDSGKVELQSLHDYAGITGCIGLIRNSSRGYDPVVSFSGVAGTTFLSLGGNLAFDIATKTFNKWNAGLTINTAFLIASLKLNDKFDTLKASCYHAVNPVTRTAIAAELKHRFSTNEIVATIGAQHALFPSTLVKARVNTHGMAGALIQQELWQKVFITLAGEVDFRDMIKLPTVGLSLALRL